MIFLGLDTGSTGCKCVAFREDGVQIASSYIEYKTDAGHADIDADEIWTGACNVISSVAAKIDSSDIKAIGITSFGEASVAVDKNGKILSRFMMYTDRRGLIETQKIIDKVGYERIMYLTCEKPDPMYSLPKIMWTLDNVAGVRENVWKFFQVSDFLCYKLTGEAKMSATLACRTMAYNVEMGIWDKELLEAGNIDESQMPEVVPCGSIVGDVLNSVAEKLNLPKNISVINTSQDQVAAAVGAGVLEVGQAVDGTGSVECITPVFDKIIRDREFPNHNFVCVPHAESGKYVTYAFNWAGGVLLKWFRDCFASHMKEEAKQKNISVYRMLDESCPSEMNDIIVVPHHMGAGGTPDMVPSAKGTITGMNMKTTVNDIYRATLEGLTFEMAYNINSLNSFGIEIGALKATGGGSSSQLWLHMKADIFNRPITPQKTDEAGAQGCAMMAGTAIGVYKNLQEAADIFVKSGETVYPDDNNVKYYIEKYQKYMEIRNKLLYSFN